ncbi:hypothetical protein BGZ81_008453 [Podila clonocystis]|nr:hypothetical protein BGZ81_008453 [Podila clonocystis]
MEGLRFDSNCVIGATEVLSKEEYPSLMRKSGDFHVILGKERAIQVYMFMFADNRLGYYFCGQMDRPEQHDEKDFRFSDWKPAAEIEQVRNFKCPFGGTVGDLIDKAPKERLSKVMLQEKYFSTWYHQRTILIGDACHKHLPFGGQGANQSILDSVHIVNQLYGIPSNSFKDIEKSFRAFYDHRSPNAKEVFQSTSMVASILSKKGMVGDLVRFLTLNHLLAFINNLGMDGMNADRPYLCFLPVPSGHGTISPKPQVVPVHFKGATSMV